MFNSFISSLLIAILIGLATGNNAYGDDPTYLNSGDKAPYSGLLFSETKADGIRKELLDLDKHKLLLETERNRSARLGQIIELKDQEIDLYQKQNSRLLKSNDRSDSLNYIWFGLGILATGAAVYGAGALSR